jgi:4-alpha-glucanotransferase
VHRLRDELGFPGMVVLQFAFNPDDPHSPHDPERHRENQVLYTGTHDNDTLRGWYEELPPERLAVLRSHGVGGRQPWWDVIELAQRSVARLCMLQVQDVLGLGNEARMNLPGTASGNWRFRLEKGQLTKRHAARLRAISEEAGRLAG